MTHAPPPPPSPSPRVVPLRQDSTVELRLLNDAFMKICDLVNDSSMGVRALASQLLGDFHHVDGKFLEQTLDKKLMSHLKVVKSDHQRQRELHQGGGASMDWDSGRTWGGGPSKVSPSFFSPISGHLSESNEVHVSCIMSFVWRLHCTSSFFCSDGVEPRGD